MRALKSPIITLFAVVFLLTPPESIGVGPSDDVAQLMANGPRISEIMSAVATPDGHIDKSIHAEFWALVPDSMKNNPQGYFEHLDVVAGMTYQKELWESIRLSARTGRVVKTLSYDSTSSRAFSNPLVAPDALLRADKMLEAAALGEPLRLGSEDVLLTEESANHVLDGLNRSTERLRQLLDPAWRGPANESDSGAGVESSELDEIASSISEGLPMDVGNFTRLDRVVAGPERRLTFYFTLTNRTASYRTPEQVAASRAALIPLTCGSESALSLLREGISLTYSYTTSDGAEFTAIDFTEDVCAAR